MDESVRWWMSTIQPPDKPERDKLVPISPQEARKRWIVLCPNLFFDCSSQDKVLYWTEIYEKIVQITDISGLEDPITNFGNFIATVYKYKNHISPKTFSDCLLLLSTFNYTNINQFILYQLPIYFGSPFRYFEIIRYIIDLNHPFWRLIGQNPSLMEAMIDMTQGFLSTPRYLKSRSAWKIRVHISDMIVCLLFDAHKRIPHSQNLAVKLLESITHLLKTAPIEPSSSLIRIALDILKKAKGRFTKQQISNRNIHILDSLAECNSPNFYMLARILIYQGALTPPKIMHVIKTHCITNLDDVQLHFQVAVADESSQLPAIIALLRAAHTNPLLFRAATTAVRSVILKAPRQDVMDWFLTYLRRIFAFIAIAKQRGKYRGRCISYMEFFSSLLASRSQWLQFPLSSYSISLMSSKNAPPKFRSFFHPKGVVDESLCVEIAAFPEDPSFKLKTFPFDDSRTQLVAPPQDAVARANTAASVKSSRSKDIKIAPVRPKGSAIRKPIGRNHAVIRPLASALYIVPVNRR